VREPPRPRRGPDLIQVGLRARWSPAATGWGVHDWLLALWAVWGASAGANRSAPRASIRYTHCNTPGACVTPARKCNARTGGAPTRAGGGTGGQPTPTPARPHIGRLPGADMRPHRRRSRRITQNTRATPGGISPTPAQIQSRGGPMPTPAGPVCLVHGLSAWVPAYPPIRRWAPTGGSNTPAPVDGHSV
jgi:hypothetical protein